MGMPSFSDKHSWMLDLVNQPIDFEIFDVRSRNALMARGFSTWGELGALTEEAVTNVPNLGEHSVSRINGALTDYVPRERLETRRNIPNMENAMRWALCFSKSPTLGSLFASYELKAGIPTEALTEINQMLAEPLDSFSVCEVPQITTLFKQLWKAMSATALFKERELSSPTPSFRVIGKSRGLTGEAVRRQINRDIKNMRKLIQTDEFLIIRWAMDLMRQDFGFATRANSKEAKAWRSRVGRTNIELLRWLCGYEQCDGWYVIPGSELADLENQLKTRLGDSWLVRQEEVDVVLGKVAHLDAVHKLLPGLGKWRDIGDGWWVKWDGTIFDKAERVLRLTCTPMTPAALSKAVGGGTPRSIRNISGTSMMRVDKKFRIALREWGLEEYEGIHTEIKQRIERGGGVASVAAITKEFVNNFKVSKSSVNTYLHHEMYEIDGDKVRFAVEKDYVPSPVSHLDYAVKVGKYWGHISRVTENSLKGYSFLVDRDIAAHNGIKPDDSLIVPIKIAGEIVGEASLIWDRASVGRIIYVGRLSTVLVERKIETGTYITLIPTPRECHVIIAN